MAAKRAKSSSTQELNIARLFTELEETREEGDYERGLKLSDRILKLSPGDHDVLHCKIVCMVQLSRFQDAAKLIDSTNKKAENSQFLFEKAYCLYRLERYNECLQLLQKMPQEDERVQELRAQLQYRLEHYSDAVSRYASMVKQFSDDFNNERETNYSASLTLSGDPSILSEVEMLHSSSMEQCFNLACCYLAVGRVEDAVRMLRKSEELCRESLAEEDYTEEEIENELSVVRLQLGYALQVQHRSEEAMGLYNTILKQKPSDVSHTVIAANNIIVLNRGRDVFDSKKKVKVLASEGNSKKLTKSQKLAILFNRCLFALLTNQLEQCRQLVAEMKEQFPENELAFLAVVSLLHRERKNTQCVELLEQHLKSKPNSSLSIYLTLAQLYMLQGNVQKVCQILHSIPKAAKYLGVVSVQISLYTSTGSIDAAIEVFDDAVAWWAGQPKSDYAQKTAKTLMVENSLFKLQHGRPEAAAVMLEKLKEEFPSDLKALALLISAYSQFDPKKAEEYSQSLPKFEAKGTVDVVALEQMPSFKLQRRQVQKLEAKSIEEVEMKEKRKKKRKPHYPKKYDPAATADPERWLPLRERSYYRRGKRKGFLSVGRGTQGTSATMASITAQLDASKPKAQEVQVGGGGGKIEAKGGKTLETSPRPKAPSTQQTKKKQQKKKKKGKGW